MKSALLIPLVIALPLFGDPADDYVNFIRQVQADGTGEWDLWDLEPTGEAMSYEGVGDNGSDFELWSIYSPSGAYYELDTQFVAAYTPSAEIEIVTSDPYPTIKRTRADKGYTLYIRISGLVDPANVTNDTPAAAQQVIFKHDAYTYPSGSVTLEGYSVTPESVQNLYITGNGDYPASPGYQEFSTTTITSGNINGVQGEEHFEIIALADFGVAESQLETSKIQIWPVASASINGLDSSTYYETVPPISIDLYELYPSSTTWLQVFPGAPTSTPDPSEVIILNDTVFLWNAAIPTDRTQSLSDWDVYLTAEGEHTLQVIHETPWGQEILAEQTFSVDRTVEFKGNIISK